MNKVANFFNFLEKKEEKKIPLNVLINIDFDNVNEKLKEYENYIVKDMLYITNHHKHIKLPENLIIDNTLLWYQSSNFSILNDNLKCFADMILTIDKIDDNWEKTLPKKMIIKKLQFDTTYNDNYFSKKENMKKFIKKVYENQGKIYNLKSLVNFIKND